MSPGNTSAPNPLRHFIQTRRLLAALTHWPPVAGLLDAGAGARMTLVPRVAFFSLTLGFAALCPATEPLTDVLIVGNDSGPFWPEKCCWIDLPKTERLVEARRAEECSALGGPVGRFQLEDNKIWLVGLRRCRGDVPLHDIYPELDNPSQATWLNGVLFAKIAPMCITQHGERLYRTTLRLEVKKGVVTHLQREEHAEAACRGELQ